jgi:hypothetical protein
MFRLAAAGTAAGSFRVFGAGVPPAAKLYYSPCLNLNNAYLSAIVRTGLHFYNRRSHAQIQEVDSPEEL